MTRCLALQGKRAHSATRERSHNVDSLTGKTGRRKMELQEVLLPYPVKRIFSHRDDAILANPSRAVRCASADATAHR